MTSSEVGKNQYGGNGGENRNEEGTTKQKVLWVEGSRKTYYYRIK